VPIYTPMCILVTMTILFSAPVRAVGILMVNIIGKREKTEKPINVNNYIKFLLTASQF
jgi:hypothetical protein